MPNYMETGVHALARNEMAAKVLTRPLRDSGSLVFLPTIAMKRPPVRSARPAATGSPGKDRLWVTEDENVRGCINATDWARRGASPPAQTAT